MLCAASNNLTCGPFSLFPRWEREAQRSNHPPGIHQPSLKPVEASRAWIWTQALRFQTFPVSRAPSHSPHRHCPVSRTSAHPCPPPPAHLARLSASEPQEDTRCQEKKDTPPSLPTEADSNLEATSDDSRSEVLDEPVSQSPRPLTPTCFHPKHSVGLQTGGSSSPAGKARTPAESFLFCLPNASF